MSLLDEVGNVLERRKRWEMEQSYCGYETFI